MKTILSIALLLGFVIVTCAQEASTNPYPFIKRGTLTRAQADEIGLGYHESDDMFIDDDYLAIYMNRTGPRDTIYIYAIKEPTFQCTGTTKAGNRCKLHTSHETKRCHHHRPEVIAEKEEQ